MGGQPGEEHHGRHQPAEHHAPLGRLPRVGPVLAPHHPPPAEGEAHRAQHRPGRQGRDSGGGGHRSVEQPVGPEAEAAHAGHQQAGGEASGPRRGAGAAAVAPGVHGGGQPERAVEGVLEHRDGDAPQGVEAAGRPTPELAGPADPLDALHQLGRHAQRHHHRHPELVEGAGQHPEGTLGIGQRVGRPQAADQAAEPHPGVQRPEGPLHGDRPAEPEPGGPGRQRQPGEGEQGVHALGGDVAAEDGQEDHADGHHGEGEPEVVPEGPGPGGVGPTVDHHHGEDAEQQQQQDGVGHRGGGHGQTDRPQPPGHRVQGAGDPPAGSPGGTGGGSHGHGDRRRRQASAPATPATATTRPLPTRPGRPGRPHRPGRACPPHRSGSVPAG